jgi:hypothetical protein
VSRIAARLVLALGVVTVLAALIHRVPEALAHVGTFRATEHEFQGLRFLTPEAVLSAAGIGPDANIWDDPGPWEEHLEAHPLILDATVGRRFPGTLVISLTERTPVGLVPTPALEPVDRDGRFLPLDPSRFLLDYPILRPRPVAGEEGEASAVQRRELAAAAETMRQESDFWNQVSEIAPGPHGGFEVRWGESDVIFRFSKPVELRRIWEGMAALEDARARNEGRLPRKVDLRFADLVVLGWEGEP